LASFFGATRVPSPKTQEIGFVLHILSTRYPRVSMGIAESAVAFPTTSGLQSPDAENITYQLSKIQTVESSRRGDDFLNFAFCPLHFDLLLGACREKLPLYKRAKLHVLCEKNAKRRPAKSRKFLSQQQ